MTVITLSQTSVSITSKNPGAAIRSHLISPFAPVCPLAAEECELKMRNTISSSDDGEGGCVDPELDCNAPESLIWIPVKNTGDSRSLILIQHGRQMSDSDLKA